MVYPLVKWIIPSIYKLWLKKAEGEGNIPKDKPFIIAANHSSYYDVILPHSIIIPKLNKKIHALVSSIYWKFFIARLILDWGECIPVYIKKEKDARKKNDESFRKALGYLDKGEPVMIFPEGTRSPDGKLKKAYSGVARLALISGAPVLPIGIINSHKVLPKGKIFPRFTRAWLKIGKPMKFGKHSGRRISNKLLEKTTRDIMKKIAGLTGQQYRH